MKLAYYQIEHIKQYIDQQNIWYDDVKGELLDHIVCAVEHEMEVGDRKFVDALARVLIEIDPSALQRQKLKVEHIATFKDVYHELTGFFTTSKALYPLAAFMGSILFAFWCSDLKLGLQLFHGLSVLALFGNFIARTWRNAKFKPLYNVYFMSRLNAIYTPSFLIGSLVSLLISTWLVHNPIAFVVYLGSFATFLIAGFLVMNRTFLKLKKHAATQ